MSGRKRMRSGTYKFAAKMGWPVVTKRRKFIKRSNLGLNQKYPEQKYQDYILADPLIPLGTANTAVWLISGVAQGTDNTNRIGRKTLAKSIAVNCNFTGATWNTLGTAGSTIRWWIVLDAQPDGVIGTAAEIWALGGGTYLTAHRNLDNSERFKILRTGTVELAPTPTGLAGEPGFEDKKYISEYIKLNDACRYQGTDATIASIASGAYYFCYCTDVQGNVSGPAATFNARVKFTDE